jgi:sugar lactone lactonase YvrE
MNRGFTLIQISILLIAASLVLVAILPSTRTTLNANNATTARLNSILTAMRGYEASHAALPCPADASQPIGSTSYGQAAANPGTGTPGNCTGGTPAANYVDVANNVAVGMVPVRALGLSNDYALDAYGRDITYAVDTNATVCFSGTLPGKITVTDNGPATNTIAAVISHGADGHGAWIPLTGTSGTAVRLNSGSTDTNTLLNAHVNSSFTSTTPLTNFVRSPPTPTFDDLLVYKSNLWTLDTAPLASAPLLASVVGPASGSYYTGQTLTFLVTYGSAAAVTGTPELALSVPQQNGTTAARYASYVSSSGNTMTFSYTVQSSDYVPSTSTSAALVSPIVLNGGTITVGGAAACLTFTPPSLTGVLLNPVTIYVVDSSGNRVEEFNASGTYIGQLGGCSSGGCSSGTGNGQLNDPIGIALDKSGNIWVTDSANQRVQEFNNSGTYQFQFGYSAGSGGPFDWPFGIAFDASGNIWVVNNNPGSPPPPYAVLKFNTSGTLLSEFGSYNTGSAQLGQSSNLAIDVNGNLWISEPTGPNLQEFSSSGTYLASVGTSYPYRAQYATAFDSSGNLWTLGQPGGVNEVQEFSSSGALLNHFGSTGSGNGQFNFTYEPDNGGIAIDPSGNLWVVDTGNNRVEEFSNCGTYLNQFGSAGTGNGQFNVPEGIAISPNTPGGGGACIASVTPPANGAYSTGQTITFTVTYNQAVTVSGTPRLVLTIGSNTRYANYLSGGGTNTLTFTYTIQSSDTATGMAVGSSIDLNGGTIGSNSIAANLDYTAPAMGGITINSTAFMLVADSVNNRVQKLDLVGNYISQFGSSGTGNGQFNNPLDAAVDGSGNIWVVDGANARVEEFNSSGVYQSQFGSAGTGNGQFYCCTYNGTITQSANSIAIDASGNFWVVDNDGNRVEKFNSSGTYQSQLGCATGDCGGSSSNGQFNNPWKISLDASGNIYVGDYGNNRVEKFNSSGTWQQTFGPTIPGYGTLNGEGGLAVDACNNVWINDKQNGGNVVETDYAGNYLSSFNPNAGVETGLQIDSGGKIYVLSADSNVIDVFNSSGTLLNTLGSSGSGNGQLSAPYGFTLVGSAITPLPRASCPAVILSAAGPSNGTYTTGGTLGFAVTYDQAVTVTGTPYIPVTIGANTRAANYISGSGTTTLTFQYTIVAGDNAQTGITMNVPVGLNSGTISSNSIASDLYFQPPTLTQVLVNPATYSNFYIADTSNHRVRKVTQSTGYISTVAGTGTSGAFTAGTATSSKLSAPNGVALDSSGNLYIADTGDHAVAKVNTSGTLSYFAGTGTSGTITAGAATSSKLNSPAGVAFDGSGNAYIADSGNHEVLKVNTSGTLSIFAGTGTSGTITAGTATSSKLNSPTGVAVDSSGNVYIADGGNHAVLKVNTSGSLAYFAGTGTSGSTNDNNNSAATSAKLKTPYGVAWDSSSNVYIADSGNDVILKVTASTGKIAIITGTVGTASYSGDNGAATSATESAAKGVAVDSSGNVYIADTGNNLVRWIITTFGDIGPIAGNGTGGYSGDGAAATAGEINAPTGIAVSR